MVSATDSSMIENPAEAGAAASGARVALLQQPTRRRKAPASPRVPTASPGCSTLVDRVGEAGHAADSGRLDDVCVRRQRRAGEREVRRVLGHGRRPGTDLARGELPSAVLKVRQSWKYCSILSRISDETFHRIGDVGPQDIGRIRGQRDRRQDGDDRHRDHDSMSVKPRSASIFGPSSAKISVGRVHRIAILAKRRTDRSVAANGEEASFPSAGILPTLL